MSEEKPYFGFTLNLDPALVASVMMESGTEIKKADVIAKGISINSVDADLVDAAARLIRLLDTPNEGKILVPLLRSSPEKNRPTVCLFLRISFPSDYPRSN